jgi:hypothetical protein
MNLFRAALAAFALMVICNGFAQGIFSIGYNLGRFTAPQRNFDVLEYEFRNAIPGFKIPQYLYGASLGARIGEDNYFAEVLITNRRNSSKNYQYVGSDGNTYEYEVKMRLRTLNLGMAAGTDVIKFGASLDLGMFKLFKKNGQAGTKPQWENFYDDHSLFMGMTFFMPVQLDMLEVRPYYQVSFVRHEFALGYDRYAHRSGNIGLNISLVIGD